MHTLIWFFAAFISAAVAYLIQRMFVPSLINYAKTKNLLDYPSDRRIHKEPIPRIGGISVVGGFYLGLLFQYFFLINFNQPTLNVNLIISYMIGSLFVFLVGLYDDLKPLKAIVKLLSQLSIGICMYLLDVRVGTILGHSLSWQLDLIITIVWFICILNAFNLIDGFDGVATGLGCIAGLGIGASLIFRGLFIEAIFISPLIGAGIGFLYFNRNPAKIFLGDSGSMFIGFTLAWLALATMSKGPAISAIWVPFLAMGIPLFDLFLAVWRRLIRRIYNRLVSSGEKVGLMAPDLDHIHHKLSRTGLSARNVAGLLYLLNCFFVLIGIAGLLFRQFAFGISVGLFALLTILIIRYVAIKEIQQSGLVLKISLGKVSLSYRSLLNIFIKDVFGLSVIFLLSIWITLNEYYPLRSILKVWLYDMPLWVYTPAMGLLIIEIISAIGKHNDRQPVKLNNKFVLGLLLLIFFIAMLVTNFFVTGLKQATIYIVLIFSYLIFIRVKR
jgi:UDP-GlcNAc:undecaprenyl-phosphate GlcNAc-1-phosphate transferase